MHALALAMLGTLMLLAPCIHVATAAAADSPAKIQLADDPAAGQLRVLIGDQEALVYVYSAQHEMPHYYPVRSPSGKSMTVQQTEPYPHHRSFWFADRVRRAGQRDVNFYAALYTRGESGEASSPFNDRIRHVRFTRQHTGGNQATVEAELVWEMDRGQTPVLDEARRMRVVALGEGQYFVDVVFTLTAAHDAVTFTSDAVHYAWPFIRINQTFNVTHGGGTITNSTGGVNQHGTNMKEARWVDYSCTVDGVTEGLAMFSHPDNAHPHRWLTRDYGTFGPRREDARSGQPFTLDRGDSLTQRVGVLVHRGDAKEGEVAKWYRQYAGGRL